MKRIVTLITACSFCLATITINAQNGSNQLVDFEIEAQGHVDTPVYRAPAMAPVQGYYVSFVNTLYLSFAYDMGNVTVTVENIGTGEFLS